MVPTRSSPNAEMDAWMANAPSEDVLEPELTIIDAHHHLWDHTSRPMHHGVPRQRVWMLPDILTEISESGHNVAATVYVQAGSFYRDDGPKEFRSVGETEFVQGVAAVCESDAHGPALVGAAIVGTADLRHPDIEAILRTHMQSRNFVGIRMMRRVDCPVPTGPDDVAFEHGLKVLEKLGLIYDVWQTSKSERDFGSVARVMALAIRYPKVTIVLNHLGCTVGPDMGAASFDKWRADLAALAQNCPNVFCKLGGIQMPVNGWGLEKRAAPIGSKQLCDLTLPFYGHAIDCFGPYRCMFESNFPVDKDCVSYRVLWNSFKLVAAARRLTSDEKNAVFYGTAAKVYRIQPYQRGLSSL